MDAEFLKNELASIFRTQLQQRTAADAIYWTLRDAIRKGLIAPGSRLIEDEVASALDISRTPVREALRRLQSEKLLEKDAGRSLVVPVLTIDDLLEIYEIEEVIFGLVARKAAQYMGSSELEMLGDYVNSEEKAIGAGDFATVSEATAQFHNLIAHGCRNERLQSMYQQLNAPPRLRLFEFAPERINDALAEHRALYNAIAAHDGNRAEELAREHTRNALRAQIKAQTMKMGTA